ncbi:uncharacterized protein [Cicer arietinum]|uniref:Uncharacterized protein LOC101494047 n=1 Tax=Cicer arietinum TaxID=3827 RepID=A0A1S3E1Q9_CICAR|nr:uncharacterized protein LOC101494047 [Cicer arietinum]
MSQVLAPFQLLELNVISAQDLASVGRNMRTYAVAWVHPDRKLSTRVDTQGHTNPTWNDKFVFRVDDEFLYNDTSAFMIEIYALHWFKDIHVGTVRVLVGNLITPPSRPFHKDNAPIGMRFVALQVRRPSGRPQGILNIGVTVLDSSMRSMPLYTHNASAVGYRHLMGEKDAYDSHNHLSPHVFAAGGGKPELRRTKSDSSSVIASEAVMRHQRAMINMERACSAISGSEVSDNRVNKNRKKKKKKTSSSSSQTSSIISGDSGRFTSSVLSDAVVPWKVKNGKASSSPSDINVQPPPPPFNYEEQHGNNNNENEIHHDRDSDHEHEHDNKNDIDDNQKEVSSDNTVSDDTTTDTDVSEKQNIAYQVNATPKRHFPPSPAPRPAEYKNSPKPKFMKSPTMPEYRNSPKPHYKNSPLPEYKSSPKPQFKNSPMPEYKNSPKPQFKNSPMPEYKNSPMPEYKNTPKPQYMRSPTMPEYKNTPKPQYRNSPMPEFKNSPVPQFRNSPMPEFKNSPMAPVRNSPMPQFKNSPMPQFRNSPAVSKFNPAMGFSGSQRGTPMHPFGKINGAFEYATPMRSNLANMRPVMMTESELGPSPSEVAAAMARKPMVDEGDNSTMTRWSLDESVEGLGSKLDRWRTELPPVIDRGELSSLPTNSTKTSRHSRRHTDGGGGNGLFSCFSNICGVECSIVCGSDSKAKVKKNSRTRTSSTADDNTSIL